MKKKWFLYVVLVLTLTSCITEPKPEEKSYIQLNLYYFDSNGHKAKVGSRHRGLLYVKELGKSYEYELKDGQYTIVFYLPKRTSYTVIVSSSDFGGFTSEEALVFTNSTIVEVEIFSFAPPTVSIERVNLVKKTEVLAKGSLDRLGDIVVQEYGFCFSTENIEPTIEDTKVFLTDKKSRGAFEFKIQNLQEDTRYFIRPYATNKQGTSYGDVIEFVTVKPPLVPDNLLVYYTFDEANCNNYLLLRKFDGLLNGIGEPPHFVTDTPNEEGKAMKCTSEKFYILRQTPIYKYASISVWIKTTNSNGKIYEVADTGLFNLNNYKVNPFDIDLTTILFDGSWHHLVVNRSYENHRIYLSLYIDGKHLVKQKEDYYYDSSSEGKQGKIGFGYTGLIDNLRIYDRNLSSKEIQEIYQAKQ